MTGALFQASGRGGLLSGSGPDPLGFNASGEVFDAVLTGSEFQELVTTSVTEFTIWLLITPQSLIQQFISAVQTTKTLITLQIQLT